MKPQTLLTPTLSALAMAALVAGNQAVAQDERSSRLVLSPVTVTSDPFGDRSVDDLVSSTTVISGDDLERRRRGTIGEVLEGIPGIANSDFGPGVGRPVIRGLQGSRVLVLEDGMRTTDVSGEGADHAVGVDPLRAEQVEVIRGPAALIYGSGAAGGVVNVVTNRFSPVIPETVSGRLSGNYGDNGNDRQGHASLDIPVGANFAIRTDINARRTSDFDIRGYQLSDGRTRKRGKLINSDLENDSYSFTGMYSGDWGYMGLGYSYWETDYGIPGNFFPIPRDEGGFDDDFERITAESDTFDLRGEIRNPFRGFSTARLKVSYTEFEQEEAEFEFERATGRLDERVVEAEFEKDELDMRLELLHDPIAGMKGVIGFEFVDTDFEADDPRGDERGFYVRPNESRSMALFSVQELPTEFGKLEFGARIGHERFSPDDVRGSRVEGTEDADGNFVPFEESLGSRSFTLLSFSVGALVDVGQDHHFRTSLTATERAPSSEQLYAFGRHAAAGTFEVGDPDLDKETYLNLEVGFDRHAGPIRYDATVFYNRVDDFTYLESVDEGTGNPVFVDDVGDPAGDRLRNQLVFNEQADAEFYGVELGSSFELIEPGAAVLPLTMRISGDYVRGRLRSGGNLPRITPPRIGLGFDTSWQDFDFSVDYQRVAPQTRTGTAETRTAGYHLYGLDVAYHPANVDGLRLFLAGRNLGNESGRRHQSFFKDEAPIIGRAFYAGFRYDFGG